MLRRASTTPPWRGWLPMIILPGSVLLLAPPGWPAWAFMWCLAVAIFFGCKWLTWRRRACDQASWWRRAGYLVAWPGLDTDAFLQPSGASTIARPRAREWLLASSKLLGGAALFRLIHLVVSDRHPILLGWAGMVGIVLMLHFGAFHLLSCGWRLAGVDARPIMNRPLASASVGEFWGRRWNAAFHHLVHRFIFRPLKPRIGPRAALMAAFLFSGLVHEVVISLPAAAGYGLPTLFFAIQAFALLFERSHYGKALGLATSWRGWLFMMTILALPAFGLFHPPFVLTVVVPFMSALGAA